MMQWLTGPKVDLSRIYLIVVGSSGLNLAYISNRRLLLSLADAGGRLMYAYKELLELAGRFMHPFEHYKSVSQPIYIT